ncbi:DUF7007 domain-containing protein (plasmid) [Pseudarthrobacter sp. P1]|uniref:DUF7007 domain-containing protein n=1 Tax=Pseudarthrobacter sp. P1 TaxID=3418418 RepID=UPI003CE94B75
MTENMPARQPKGVTVGGQFAATAHAEPELTLHTPEQDILHDADGTAWGWADPDTQILETDLLNGIGIRLDTDTSGDGGFHYEIIDHQALKKIGAGEATTVAEAKEAAKAGRSRAAAYGRTNLHVGSRTPWGAADGVEPRAAGIDSVFTPGHGGLKLSAARNREVAPAWRRPGAWYEEDCDFAIAVITHWRDLPEKDVAYAHENARRWNPVEYEQVVGKDPAAYGITDYQPIRPGESRILDEHRFFAAHADTVDRVWSASSSASHAGMVEVTVSAVLADGTRGAHARRAILVPEEEYRTARANFNTLPKDAPYPVLDTKEV